MTAELWLGSKTSCIDSVTHILTTDGSISDLAIPDNRYNR
jgi:hypothetical protein